MFRTSRTLAVVASIGLATSMAAAPAHADTETFKDKRGDVRSGFDIRSVHVKNDGAWVKVRTKHRSLRRGTQGRVAVYINALYWDGGDVSDRGPEFVLSGGVGSPAGHGISTIRSGWHSERTPLRCGSLRFSIDYKRDIVRFAVLRGCLSAAHDMAVNDLRVAAVARVNDGRRDWAPKRHRFYRKVEQG